MIKRITSIIILCLLLLTLSVYATDSTESSENIPKIVLDVSEPDEDGYFTADFIIYNAVFKGVICGFRYDVEIIVPVDYETLEPTTVFSQFAVKQVTIEDTKTGEKTVDLFEDVSSSIDEAKGEIYFVTAINSTCKDTPSAPNSLVTSNQQILATKEGVCVYRFYFKRISDESINIQLMNLIGGSGLILAKNGGFLSYDFSINFVADYGENFSQIYYPFMNIKVSDESVTTEEELEKRIQGRTNGVIFLQIGNYATVSDSYLKWIDKDNKDVVPYIKNNRTYVPVRYLAEELGAKVSYNHETQQIFIKNANTELVLTLDETTYTDDGLEKEMDVKPEIVEGRTFVPVRFVAEALDRDVFWNEKDQMVVITSLDYPWSNNNAIEKELMGRVKTLISPLIRDMV